MCGTTKAVTWVFGIDFNGQLTQRHRHFVQMDYNSRLKHISNKGLCGDPEIVEETNSLEDKVQQLVALICESKRIVLFTGAGISTSSGIPDFRGPNGVWTKEQRGEVADPRSVDNTFDLARPTYTHYAMTWHCCPHCESKCGWTASAKRSAGRGPE
jgi:hypothetical protein